MRLEAPFRAAGEHIAADLPGAHVLFTTRRGGVSTGPYASLNLGLFTEDDPAHVSENRDRVAAAVGVPRRRFQQGFQVHAAHVRALDAPPDPDEEPVPADGQATSVPDVATVVVAADCVPIAVAAPGAVAVLHAGLRGLHAGVVAEGVRAVRELGGTGPVAAAIGISTTLWIGAAWIVVSTLVVCLVPDVRSFRMHEDVATTVAATAAAV